MATLRMVTMLEEMKNMVAVGFRMLCVVCWKEEVRCKALSQQGFKVFVNSEQVEIPVRDG